MARTGMDDLKDCLVGRLYRISEEGEWSRDFLARCSAILITDVGPVSLGGYSKTPIRVYDLTDDRPGYYNALHFHHLTPIAPRDLTPEESWNLADYEAGKGDRDR